ncbi:MAG TPA: response regulator transcription factor [Rubrivivax sp.]|nr:response regulator transcription factor [Rubrivivax sp.]HPO18779.1 response regulator transcription factor [Rubrivivax sp.]
MIELLIVDDHTIFRAGLQRLISDEPDLRVTGEAADGASALALLRLQRFDVVLMDINMGARNGLETLAAIRIEWPRLPVIMLSMYVQAQYAKLALRSRANAYLSKDTAPDELLRAIRHVAQGGVYVGAGLALLQGDADAAVPHQALTPREMQVMLDIARGVPLTEIGTRLCISVKTVGSHRSRILDKLGIHSNAELVQYAMRHGLVD